MSDTMWALQFGAFGNPAEVLSQVRVPKPVPAADEVLVRLEARPVNPSDVLLMRGLYNPAQPLPCIAGYEGVGVVVAAGEAAGFEPGARVAFWAGAGPCPGSWAEFCAVKGAEALAVPAALPAELAAQVVLNPLTMMGIVEELGGVQAGEWVLVTAGFSACSKYLIQHLKLRGIKTISVVRQTGQVQPLKDLGSDEVVCLAAGESIPERVAGITGGQGVKYAVDCVWGPLANDLLAALGPRGTLVVYGMFGGVEANVSILPMLFGMKQVKAFGHPLWRMGKSKTELQSMVDVAAKELMSGSVKLPSVGFGLAELDKMLAHAEAEGKSSKGLLINSESKL